MRKILSLPFLVIPFIAFNVLLFLKPDLLDYRAVPQFTIPLPTSGVLLITVSDLILMGAVLLLVLQIIRNLSTEQQYLSESFGPILILLILIAEFLFIDAATNSRCIFLLLFISLLDVLFLLMRKRAKNFSIGGIH